METEDDPLGFIDKAKAGEEGSLTITVLFTGPEIDRILSFAGRQNLEEWAHRKLLTPFGPQGDL